MTGTDTIIWWFGAVWLLLGGTASAILVAFLLVDWLLDLVVRRMGVRAVVLRTIWDRLMGRGR